MTCIGTVGERGGGERGRGEEGGGGRERERERERERINQYNAYKRTLRTLST